MSSPSRVLPIIALDHTPWHSNWMNRQHLLSRLAQRQWPVTYSNGAKFYHELNFRALFGSVEIANQVKIYQSGLLLPRNYKSILLDKLAINIHSRELLKASGIKKGDDFILLCFHPSFYPYIEVLNPTFLMFHIYDVYQKLGANSEPNNFIELLIKKANIVTAASENMWCEVVGNSDLVPNIIFNGVDNSLFENIKIVKSTMIEKITHIAGPRIGYVGAINLKIDFKLLYQVAVKCSDYQFIFVGNVIEKQIASSQKATDFYHKCLSCDNIHFMGAVSKELVPQILGMMDINIIIYTHNKYDWVQAGYPLKINEYLAVGKPVIASYMPILKQHFESNINICTSVDDWCQTINLALRGEGAGTEKSRKNMAKLNDWTYRVDKLENLMSKMIQV